MNKSGRNLNPAIIFVLPLRVTVVWVVRLPRSSSIRLYVYMCNNFDHHDDKLQITRTSHSARSYILFRQPGWTCWVWRIRLGLSTLSDNVWWRFTCVHGVYKWMFYLECPVLSNVRTDITSWSQVTRCPGGMALTTCWRHATTTPGNRMGSTDRSTRSSSGRTRWCSGCLPRWWSSSRTCPSTWGATRCRTSAGQCARFTSCFFWLQISGQLHNAHATSAVKLPRRHPTKCSRHD